MNTADINGMFGVENPRQLPPSPEAATLVASLFHMLGGSLHIDDGGNRRVIIPEPCVFDGELPALPDSVPTERFLNGDEFRGAIKLITGVLNRLHPSDKEFIYDAFAHCWAGASDAD